MTDRSAAPPLPQNQPQLNDLWGPIARNIWLVIVSLTTVVGGAAFLTWQQVPVYEAMASIRIDEEGSDVPVLQVLQTISRGGSQVETEMAVLRSRLIAEEVVDALGLQLVVSTPRRVSRSEVVSFFEIADPDVRASYLLVANGDSDGSFTVLDGASEEPIGVSGVGEIATFGGMSFVLSDNARTFDEISIEVVTRRDAASSLQGGITIDRPSRDANLVTIRYESADTQLVHAIPNTLAARFISRRQNVQKVETNSAIEFLSAQIDTLGFQLVQAEDSLQEFREGAQVVSLQAEATAQVTQLVQLQADRNAMNAERVALRELVDEIDLEAEQIVLEMGSPSPYRRLMAFPTLLRNAIASQLLGSLQSLETARNDLLSRRTYEDPDVQLLTIRVTELEEQLRDIALTYLQGLRNQVASMDESLIRFGAQLELIPAKEIQFARLQRQANVLDELYTMLQRRLNEARITAAVLDASIRIIDRAVPAGNPIRPNKSLNMAIALVFGLLLGAVVANGREYLDTTVRTRDDMRRAMEGEPVLGMIPRIRMAGWNGRKSLSNGRPQDAPPTDRRLITIWNPTDSVSEAFRTIRTNISFLSPTLPPKTIVITSPLPGEGKSTTAANLAVTVAQQQRRVILIDGDLRKGLLHSLFGYDASPGLSGILTRQASFAEAVVEIAVGDSTSFHLLPRGACPPNPAELLGSSGMRSFLQELRDRYDLVLIDTPPANILTDAAVISTDADGVIIVARASNTTHVAIRYVLEQLRAVRAPILGSILNDVVFRRDGTYGEYGAAGAYYQYYGNADGEKR